MVAKIIASGPSREIARLRLIEALQETVLFGPSHNRDFLVACLQKLTALRAAPPPPLSPSNLPRVSLLSVIPGFADSAVAAVIERGPGAPVLYASSVLVAPQLRDWSSASALISARKRYRHGEVMHDLAVTPLGAAPTELRERVPHWRVLVATRYLTPANHALVELLSIDGKAPRMGVDGRQHLARFLESRGGQAVSLH